MTDVVLATTAFDRIKPDREKGEFWVTTSRINEIWQSGFDEIRRVVREEEPPRPSTRGDASGELRGDLDWIVMRAMEKDRNRRYESAGEFARDVQRYLDDEPVEARPPSDAI